VLTAAAVAAALRHPAGSPSASTCTVESITGPANFTLTPEQTQNASIIAAVAIHLGLPDHAVSIALATSLQESGLLDLPYGDRDSVGLFQQRPSQGWGTTAQILDPVYAATAFYTHLERVPGWAAMADTAAAQAVQQSATPDAYAQWDSEARSFAAALTGEAPAALTCRVVSFAGAAPAPGTLARAAQTELGSAPDGSFTDKTGWQVAEWLVSHSWAYHIRQVTFGPATWTAAGKWHGASRATAGRIAFT
jgi:hypothetical protein